MIGYVIVLRVCTIYISTVAGDSMESREFSNITSFNDHQLVPNSSTSGWALLGSATSVAIVGDNHKTPVSSAPSAWVISPDVHPESIM